MFTQDFIQDRRNVIIDVAEVFQVFFRNMKVNERDRAISDLVSNLSKDEKEIEIKLMSIKADIVREYIPFMERMRREYKKGIPRSILRKNSNLEREIQATSLAMKALKNIAPEVMRPLDKTSSQVLKARSSFNASIGSIASIFAELSGPSPMGFLESGGPLLNLELKMHSLEEKVNALLNSKERWR